MRRRSGWNHGLFLSKPFCPQTWSAASGDCVGWLPRQSGTRCSSRIRRASMRLPEIVGQRTDRPQVPKYKASATMPSPNATSATSGAQTAQGPERTDGAATKLLLCQAIGDGTRCRSAASRAARAHALRRPSICARRWQATELRPDVILLDMQLPNMTGLEVLKSTRAMRRRRICALWRCRPARWRTRCAWRKRRGRWTTGPSLSTCWRSATG